VRGSDEGIWRRIRIIPFNVHISEEKVDAHLTAKLAAELPGFLNWALEGTRKWLAEGLKAPQVVVNASRQYREEEDVLADFLDDATVAVPNVRTSRSEMYAAYRRWAESIGLRHFLTTKGFVRRMLDKGTEEGIARSKGDLAALLVLGNGLADLNVVVG